MSKSRDDIWSKIYLNLINEIKENIMKTGRNINASKSSKIWFNSVYNMKFQFEGWSDSPQPFFLIWKCHSNSRDPVNKIRVHIAAIHVIDSKVFTTVKA